VEHQPLGRVSWQRPPRLFYIAGSILGIARHLIVPELGEDTRLLCTGDPHSSHWEGLLDGAACLLFLQARDFAINLPWLAARECEPLHSHSSVIFFLFASVNQEWKLVGAFTDGLSVPRPRAYALPS
jgi:hypothetical protein